MNKQLEEFKNRALAKLLTEHGVAAEFEQRRGRKRMDVVADVEGLRVALEAETGYRRKSQAIKDADARLRQKLATVVFAVCYPEGTTEDNLAEAALTWTVRVKAGAPSAEWSTGDVHPTGTGCPAGAAFHEWRRFGCAVAVRWPGLSHAAAQDARPQVGWREPWTFHLPNQAVRNTPMVTSLRLSAGCWSWLRP